MAGTDRSWAYVEPGSVPRIVTDTVPGPKSRVQRPRDGIDRLFEPGDALPGGL